MSELRKDIVTGDWIIAAPERAKRPHQLLPPTPSRKVTPKRSCPFENLEESGNWPPVFLVPNDAKRWRVAVIPNKYPALRHSKRCAVPQRNGPYWRMDGIGHHHLVVSRDHRKNLADMSPQEGLEIFEAFQRLFKMADRDRCMAYVSAFFNWGASAGASLYHPHYQVLTLPIIPPAVEQSLNASRTYFTRTGRCVHCSMLKYELRYRKRIVAEDRHAVALAPYVPRSRFEVSVYPKRHFAFFERTPRAELADTVKLTSLVLRKMRDRLNDPDLNFFIHTGPIREQRRYTHYHWHIDVIPKILIPAGFELSTGIDINVIDPDWLAAWLRGRKK